MLDAGRQTGFGGKGCCVSAGPDLPIPDIPTTAKKSSPILTESARDYFRVTVEA
ncbi:MAG TPA: hypothetical protein VFB20_15950 [Burkholderiales bacterium]|nr:hypothetical protein [Burkholderiales bacterium]